MKANSFVLLLLLAAVLGTARAEGAPAGPDASPEAIARERARIAQERRQQEARFAAEEAACYRRFAVNDCLRDVHVRRRPVLEDLRRQEIELNDLERKRQGVEQLRRTEEKRSLQKQQEEAQRRAEALQEQRERQERAATKRAERAQAEAERRAEPPREPQASTAPTAAEQADNRRQYEEKQREAREHRARRDKALADKAAKPPVAPLPPKP